MRTRGRGGGFVAEEPVVVVIDGGMGIGSEGKGIVVDVVGKGIKLRESELPCAETETLVSERVHVGAAF